MNTVENLEYAKELQYIADLKSSKRTVRITAIIQLSKIGSSRKALQALLEMANDSDREIALFAKQAIARLQTKLGDKLNVPTSTDALSAEHLLSPLPAEVPKLLSLIRTKRDEIAEELRPAVAEFLSKYGEPADGALIMQWLETTDSNLAFTYIDALESLDPQSLVGYLPKLLASEHPLLRVRAIRTLKRIDPNEAMAHLSESLASKKAEERLAGLSIAFFFPFKTVKQLVLAMLVEETDQDVLNAIETFFQLNPDPDVALRLLDLIDVQPKDKVAGLSKIFRSICEALRVAEILPPEEAKPEAMVARWRKERLKKFLADLEIQLNFCDQNRRDAIEAWLAKNAKNSEVAVFISKLAGNPATEEMFKRLVRFLPESQKPTIDLNNLASLTIEQKKAFLESLDRETFQKVRDWIRNEALQGINIICAAALRAISHFGPEEADITIAEARISSDDPMVQLAAIQILETKSPKSLEPYLTKLLLSENALVRARAVKLAIKLNPEKALETLKSMLLSSDQTSRAQAVTCLMMVPFQHIMQTLFEALAKEDNPDIAKQILLILQSNPSGIVLYKLDQIQNTVNPSVSILVAQARMELFDIMLRLGLDFNPPKEQLEESSSNQVVQAAVTADDSTKSSFASSSVEQTFSKTVSEQDSRATKFTSETKVDVLGVKAHAPVKTATGWAPKPYAVSEVRTAIRRREAAQKAAAQSKQSSPETREKVVYYTIFILLVILVGIASYQIASDKTYSKQIEDPVAPAEEISDSSEIPRTFRLGGMCRLLGKIEKVNEDGSIVFVAENRKFYVTFVASYPYMRGGETVEMELLPYLKRKDTNDYLAEGYKIEEK